ncbi:MAG: hypothetical protein Q7S37_02720 [bacterium]|nr:hypothetical protein [bacterium]
MLLGLSNSVSDIQTLHAKLPPNAQLLREDRKELENLWKEHLAPTGTSKPAGISGREGGDWLLLSLLPKGKKINGLLDYYERKLRESRNCLNASDTYLPSIEQVCDIAIGCGEHLASHGRNFLAQMFDEEFSFGAAYSGSFEGKRDKVRIWFYTESSRLTEILVHKLRNLPAYKLYQYAGGLAFAYEIPAHEESGLSWRNMEWGNGVHVYKAHEDFTGSVCGYLQQIGVPIESLTVA